MKSQAQQLVALMRVVVSVYTSQVRFFFFLVGGVPLYPHCPASFQPRSGSISHNRRNHDFSVGESRRIENIADCRLAGLHLR